MAEATQSGTQYTLRKDFSGGQNDTNAEINVQPNEASEALNVEIERDGSFSKRRGSNLLNPTPFSGAVGMVHQFRPSAGVTRLMVAQDDMVGVWDGADTLTSKIDGLTADRIVLPVPFRNLLYLMNKIDNPMIFWDSAPSDPPEIYRPGAPQPDASSMSLAANTGGDMIDGTYFVRVRLVEWHDDTFFGEPDNDLKTQVLSGGGVDQQIDVTVIPTGPEYSGSGNPDFKIKKRIMERTLVNGDVNGPYYIDGYIDDNTTTIYSFTKSDAQLLEGDFSPFVNDRLPLPKLWPFIKLGDRIVGHDYDDPGRIVWTVIDEFGILPSFVRSIDFLYLDIEDSGDVPEAVSTFGEYIIFWCGRSIHLVSIDAAGNGYSRRIGKHKLGVPGPRCVIDLPGGSLIWTMKGPYFFDGQNLIFIGEKIEDSIALLPKSSLSEMFALHLTTEQRRQVKFVFPSGGAQNNFAAKYYYRRKTLNPEGFPTAHAWTFDDGFVAKSGTVALDPATSVDKQFFGTYDGKMFEEDVTNENDHDANGLIDASWKTLWDDMDQPHIVKKFEEIWIYMSGNVPDNINLAWETDFGADGGSDLIFTDAPDADVFGTALWDQAFFAPEVSKVLHTHLSMDGNTASGRFLRLKFSNNLKNQPFTIMGYVIKWNPERTRDDSPDF